MAITLNDEKQIGSIFSSTLQVAPIGYLLCDGSAISKTVFSDLFSLMPFSSAVVTAPIASPGIVTWTNHNLTTGREIQFTTTGTLPTGINGQNIIYFVRVINTNTFHLYDTLANAMNTPTITTGRINFTGSTSGIHTATSYVYGNGTSGLLTHFSIPDFRGVFPRGTGASVGYVASANVRLGEKIDDAFGSHNHGGGNHSHSHDLAWSGNAAPANQGFASGAYVGAYVGGTINASGTIISTQGTTETRPKSLGINYFIKVM